MDFEYFWENETGPSHFAGQPTPKGLAHAAWQAAMTLEREACARLRLLLAECAPMVYANAEALHMLDGFHPQEREYDDLARRLRKELAPNA